MRGTDHQQQQLISYISLEDRIPATHPLRDVRPLVDSILRGMSEGFEGLYAKVGRPSIAPERLLRALLLQVLYTIRSERMLMEQLDYNLLFRWFVGLGIDDPVWDATVFSKNRDRLLEGDVAREFFNRVLEVACEQDLVSAEHFTVDGTLVEAWAGQKSFQPKDPEGRGGDSSKGPRNPDVDFKGEKRKNDTHESTTDPESRLYRKGPGKEAKLCFMGHVLMENRNGLVVNASLTCATGTAEREAAVDMLQDLPGAKRKTVGADKAYDQEPFVAAARAAGITPHVAQNDRNRASTIDARTTSHSEYAVSQRVRKRVEEIFGWMKTVGSMRKTRHRGVDKAGWMFVFTAAAYNLVRIRNLCAPT